MTDPTPPAQPDVDRLAAALTAVGLSTVADAIENIESELVGDAMGPMLEQQRRRNAAAILAHPDMAQWAAEAEVGRPRGTAAESITVNGHHYVHVAACPCPEMVAANAAIAAALGDEP